jgi:hypothetical protein
VLDRDALERVRELYGSMVALQGLGLASAGDLDFVGTAAVGGYSQKGE